MTLFTAINHFECFSVLTSRRYCFNSKHYTESQLLISTQDLYGICKEIFTWFSSFLIYHKQRVVTDAKQCKFKYLPTQDIPVFIINISDRIANQQCDCLRLWQPQLPSSVANCLLFMQFTRVNSMMGRYYSNSLLEWGQRSCLSLRWFLSPDIIKHFRT